MLSTLSSYLSHDVIIIEWFYKFYNQKHKKQHWYANNEIHKNKVYMIYYKSKINGIEHITTLSSVPPVYRVPCVLIPCTTSTTSTTCPNPVYH